MTRWTIIPPWLYQNTLSGLELQTVYVTGIRKKVASLRGDKAAVEAELASVSSALATAEEFLADAEDALRRIRERTGAILPLNGA